MIIIQPRGKFFEIFSVNKIEAALPVSFVPIQHVCFPYTKNPMLIALNRRVPRTKSIFDRTSSRRYSSVEYDANGFYDTQQECMTVHNNHNGDNHENHLNSTLRQNDAEAMVSSNECDVVTILFDDEDDNDEYALLYFTKCYFSSPYALLQCFFFFWIFI